MTITEFCEKHGVETSRVPMLTESDRVWLSSDQVMALGVNLDFDAGATVTRDGLQCGRKRYRIADTTGDYWITMTDGIHFLSQNRTDDVLRDTLR